MLSLEFEDQGTQHGDLVLRLDHFDRRCDSYYLAIDTALSRDQEDADKVRRALVRLLEQWRTDVLDVSVGATTHLPYEFDDQASGWLQLTATSENDVAVLPVWSTLEGHALTPSAYAEGRDRIGKTTPVWKTLRPQIMPRAEVLARIGESIAAAR